MKSTVIQKLFLHPNKIKSLMNALGIDTQSDLASRAELTPTTITNKLRKGEPATRATVAKIAKALNTTIEDIASEEPDTYMTPQGSVVPFSPPEIEEATRMLRVIYAGMRRKEHLATLAWTGITINLKMFERGLAAGESTDASDAGGRRRIRAHSAG